jgi:hypothetical protein
MVQHELPHISLASARYNIVVKDIIPGLFDQSSSSFPCWHAELSEDLQHIF